MKASGKTTARYGARRFAGAGMLLAIALASLLGACDDGPPTRPSPPPSAPPGPVTITRLELAGPDSLPPGATAQYSAIAHQSDGTTRDVTSSALWRTGNPSVLSISSSTGLATAHARGETVVTTNAGGQFALKPDVIVVPAGTFRLGGIVKDGGVPVIGVRVEVTAGTGQGLATTTTSASPQTPFPNGAYRLYGVSGDTEVRVTRDGYQEQRKKFQVTSHQTLDFDLVLTRPRPDVSGTYTLTVVAAAECATVLPEATRRRNYIAVIRQDGARLVVRLEGAKFVSSGAQIFNSFVGAVEPDGVTFKLSEFYNDGFYMYLPDVFEELAPSTFLALSGSARTTASAAGYSGTLAGPIEILEPTSSGTYTKVSSCSSTGHQFVLSR
jgi:hypothetical protein